MNSIFSLVFSLTLFAVTAMSASAQSSYRIQPGDTLQIEVLEDTTLDREVLVGPDGRITMPLAGTLRAGGRTVEQVRANLASLLEPNFASAPNVIVSLDAVGEPTDPDPINVFIIGEAAEPGRYEVAPGTTLLQLIAESGGFSRFAATKRIKLRRTDRSGKQTVFQFDYDSIIDGVDTRAAVRLAEGDVVVIPQRKLFE